LKEGGMIHFELAPNRISKAVTHRTVEEIWYFVAGRGQVWRKQNGHAAVVDVHPGVSLTIPLGTQFQFRSFSYEPLAAIAVTMPPWPGEGEAIIVKGEWEPSQP
jgi:mannose-6-phosphate isomerase-like protein (cupin superfamily)